eukprot:SAG31_NODE_8257_length_1487_cov_3.510086_2_plen_26_part_01
MGVFSVEQRGSNGAFKSPMGEGGGGG